MKKRMSLTTLAGLVAVTAFAPTAQAAIALPDVGTVGPYRVIFVTSTKPAADATVTMPEVNAFVTGVADGSGLSAAAGNPGWSVVGATSTVDLYTNTGLADTGGVAFYTPDGTLVAADNAALWALGATTVLAVDESGDAAVSNSEIQTGLISTGGVPRTNGGATLDSAAISHGGRDAGYNPWFGTPDTWNGTYGGTPLFAVSGVIPEPSSMSLLGLGGLGLLLRRRRS